LKKNEKKRLTEQGGSGEDCLLGLLVQIVARQSLEEGGREAVVSDRACKELSDVLGCVGVVELKVGDLSVII